MEVNVFIKVFTSVKPEAYATDLLIFQVTFFGPMYLLILLPVYRASMSSYHCDSSSSSSYTMITESDQQLFIKTVA